jgi:DNA-binding response OmpR family regulator
LLVHDEAQAFGGLEETLHQQEIMTRHAHGCAQARSMLEESGPVDLVLTDVALPDGVWRDVIGLVREARKPTPVIVISRVVNMRLYLDTQDGGAADFIVPPIAARELAYVLTAALHRTPVALHASAPAPPAQRRQAGPALARAAGAGL